MNMRFNCTFLEGDYLHVRNDGSSGGMAFMINSCGDPFDVLLSPEDVETLTRELAKEIGMKIEEPVESSKIGDVSYYSLAPNGKGSLYRATKTESGYSVDIIHLKDNGTLRGFTFGYEWSGEYNINVIRPYPEGKEEIDSILDREQTRRKLAEIEDKKDTALSEYKTLSEEYSRALGEYNKLSQAKD